MSNREDSTSSGLQFLFKNCIAPNPFVDMLYGVDVEFAIVYSGAAAQRDLGLTFRPASQAFESYLRSAPGAT